MDSNNVEFSDGLKFLTKINSRYGCISPQDIHRLYTSIIKTDTESFSNLIELYIKFLRKFTTKYETLRDDIEDDIRKETCEIIQSALDRI